MIDVVSIDPGASKIGWAAWSGGILRAVGLARAEGGTVAERAVRMAQRIELRLGPDGLVVMEQPQSYGDLAKQSGDQNDLIEIGISGAYFAATVGGRLKLVKPGEWKGQVPKPIMLKRIQERLLESVSEMAVFSACMKGSAKSLQHNTWDAVGIGLHHFKRIGR